MDRRKVIEDHSDVRVPSLGYGEKYELNRQTAYNRAVVVGSARCGCFRCGSTFPGEQVSEWVAEDDGDDTALCPYCGTDAVIIGTEDHPLSTSLLAGLYMLWFEDEHKALEAKATRVPRFSGREDYMRKGIPFLMEVEEEVEVVGEIRLFPKRVFSGEWGNMHDNEVFGNALGVIGEESPGGVVHAGAYFDDDGYYVAEFVDDEGNPLPYEPWGGDEQDLLLDLTERYGDKLRGAVCECGVGQPMRLFVPKAD